MAKAPTSKNYDKFRNILHEMFQLDQADLDFGIYRIMNQKRDEIVRFLDEDLAPQVRQALEEYAGTENVEMKQELDEATKQAQGLGVEPETSPKVLELKARLAGTADLTILEQEVFSALTNFFRRYYSDGDFISQRRYKEGVYAIPYEGEEVKLYWANHDQYYIKTSENFRDFAFKLPNGKRVHFKLVEAETETDNRKAQEGKERQFILIEEEPLVEQDGELFIRFEYRPASENETKKDKKTKQNQKDFNAETVKRVLNDSLAKGEWQGLHTLEPTDTNKTRTLLEKWLTEYTARNTFDYFIHKDLEGFLRRELDFYIKNEIMHLDDIEDAAAPRVEQYLAKIKAIRRIAHKIIRFLAQIENFQKKLWLKKKFVVETNYCITLDRVPEELYPDIAANEAQREEWINLFAIDEIEQDTTGNPGYSTSLDSTFLKFNDNLLMDTRFFSEDFKSRLLAKIEDFEEQCDGLLIHSENFQALKLIKERYSKSVKCIYIDPPFNTDSAPILYKNDYKHSSWATLMNNRVSLAKHFLSSTGVKIVAIDDTELLNLSKILNEEYPNYRMSRITVVHNPKGSITRDFNRVHEYALFLTPDGEKHSIARTLVENDTPRKMRRWGANSLRTERPLSFYPIYIKDNSIVGVGTVPDDSFHPKGRNTPESSDEIAVWPVDQDGIERRWNFGLDSINDNLDRVMIQEVDGTFDLFVTHEKTVPKTVWTGGEFDAGSYGNTLLIDILGEKRFDFPKSIYSVLNCLSMTTRHDKHAVILDYFSGSGTTAHATIFLNKQDNGSRKYVVVEMGKHFENVLKPRVQRIVYSEKWKNGKPSSREDGVSHCLKYMRLESYEDALNNLTLVRTKEQDKTLFSGIAEFREEYMLSYMMDLEAEGSLLSVEAFEDPFNYQMQISTGTAGETKLTKVDLVETFNYLIGLTVKHLDQLEGFRLVEGTSPKGEKVLVIWRNLKEKSNADLDTFFTKQQYNTRDQEFDIFYVNGDNNLENLRRDDQTWKVRLIEEDFKRLMFEVEDV